MKNFILSEIKEESKEDYSLLLIIFFGFERSLHLQKSSPFFFVFLRFKGLSRWIFHIGPAEITNHSFHHMHHHPFGLKRITYRFLAFCLPTSNDLVLLSGGIWRRLSRFRADQQHPKFSSSITLLLTLPLPPFPPLQSLESFSLRVESRPDVRCEPYLTVIDWTRSFNDFRVSDKWRLAR